MSVFIDTSCLQKCLLQTQECGHGPVKLHSCSYYRHKRSPPAVQLRPECWPGVTWSRQHHRV